MSSRSTSCANFQGYTDDTAPPDPDGLSSIVEAELFVEVADLLGRRSRIDVHLVDGAPHDRLFPRCAAVVHHGGSGTTAAGLRAGVPSVICPFFGDQPFWGARVAAIGAGPEPIPQKQLTSGRLARALELALADPGLRARTEAIAETLEAEDGVGATIALIEAAARS